MEVSPPNGALQSESAKASRSGDLTDRWTKLTLALEQLAGVDSIDKVIEILRQTARGIVEADGITVVLKDREFCHYVAEDAREPLWAGQRFPASHCVSGWAMRECQSVSIPDVFDDPRVPVDAYRVTFVRSMVMIPIGAPKAFAALGAYWSKVRTPSDDEISMLEMLARTAATAIENARLISTLEARVAERTLELEQTHEQLRQTQKMEIVGQLTGHVAHDFNNLLTPIFASLDLLSNRGNLDERTKRNVQRATDAAERARLLVQRLLSFARRQPLKPSATNLHTLVGDMHDLIESTMGPRMVLIASVPADIPLIWADANQLELAILNLAVNARDAMPEGGAVTLTAFAVQDDADRPDSLPAGDHVCLAVRDNGAGMDKETTARSIEPFFTTKPLGQGTGLGLSMAHGLVAQLGGMMDIESKRGIGTTVKLFLPIAKKTEEGIAQPVEGEALPPQDRGLALIVDDDELVRSGTAEMLMDLGFEVIEAETAHHGLDLINRGLEPAIVITDHLMPGMTGTEFARTLKRERPDIPVLLISGYQNIQSVAPDLARLWKPFRHKELGASIASLLEVA